MTSISQQNKKNRNLISRNQKRKSSSGLIKRNEESINTSLIISYTVIEQLATLLSILGRCSHTVCREIMESVYMYIYSSSIQLL